MNNFETFKKDEVVYCYKNRHCVFFDDIAHIEGKYYIIKEIESDFIYITSEIMANRDEPRLYRYKTNYSEDYYIFEDYFFTLKTQRKLKIKKINKTINQNKS